ncbi:hypothetical protein [Amycolatopsis cihanbeyliensis]|uniref:Uncharacterized protein n=1 Tax=Amycolatopsis cihanbeyliensis TaxID=1128664 RepID=A0A542DJK4_AMYCI|nr:hypothetical protein [Amycolatopsis cihanbeyliensis]TQJ03260.1 hypothetical protein FB471_3015 [Amycolatopsis cihanbeyliensis]
MKNTQVIHVTAKRSWWNGKVTALCGQTAEAGDYETDTWRLFGFRSGKPCPACQRIKRGGGRR